MADADARWLAAALALADWDDAVPAPFFPVVPDTMIGEGPPMPRPSIDPDDRSPLASYDRWSF
jgi:hypothetical protein